MVNNGLKIRTSHASDSVAVPTQDTGRISTTFADADRLAYCAHACISLRRFSSRSPRA
jgi:hypothetical protein